MVKRATPELSKLLKRVSRLTASAGKKPALAKHLGVHVSLIYDWIAGRNEPGGEVTLRIDRWARREENKQKKTPTRLRPAPAHKAQTENSDETKISPSRRRK